MAKPRRKRRLHREPQKHRGSAPGSRAGSGTGVPHGPEDHLSQFSHLRVGRTQDTVGVTARGQWGLTPANQDTAQLCSQLRPPQLPFLRLELLRRPTFLSGEKAPFLRESIHPQERNAPPPSSRAGRGKHSLSGTDPMKGQHPPSPGITVGEPEARSRVPAAATSATLTPGRAPSQVPAQEGVLSNGGDRTHRPHRSSLTPPQ